MAFDDGEFPVGFSDHVWCHWLAPGEPPVEKHAQQMLSGGRVGRAVSLDSQANIRNQFSIDRVMVMVFNR